MFQVLNGGQAISALLEHMHAFSHKQLLMAKIMELMLS
jgi:hypothetical protein